MEQTLAEWKKKRIWRLVSLALKKQFSNWHINSVYFADDPIPIELRVFSLDIESLVLINYLARSDFFSSRWTMARFHSVLLFRVSDFSWIFHLQSFGWCHFDWQSGYKLDSFNEKAENKFPNEHTNQWHRNVYSHSHTQCVTMEMAHSKNGQLLKDIKSILTIIGYGMVLQWNWFAKRTHPLCGTHLRREIVIKNGNGCEWAPFAFAIEQGQRPQQRQRPQQQQQQPECWLLIGCRKNHLCSPFNICIYCAIILDNDGDSWLDFLDWLLLHINADTTTKCLLRFHSFALLLLALFFFQLYAFAT